jgi:hypothetical protein
MKNNKIKFFLIILQGMEDFAKSDRKGFSQANLYFGNVCSGLTLNVHFSLQLKLCDLVRATQLK